MGRPKRIIEQQIVEVIANDGNLSEEELLKLSDDADELEESPDVDAQPVFMQTTDEPIIAGIEVKTEELTKAIDNVDFKNFKYLKMNVDHKPRYDMGWLTKGECYNIEDIGFEIAIKLIETGGADWLENKPERLSALPQGRTYKTESAKTQISLLAKLKEEALKRQGVR